MFNKKTSHLKAAVKRSVHSMMKQESDDWPPKWVSFFISLNALRKKLPLQKIKKSNKILPIYISYITVHPEKTQLQYICI